MKLPVIASTICLLVMAGSLHVLAFCPRPSGRTTRAACVRLWGTSDPLATEGDWTAYLDGDNTGMVYYFNTKTGESLWEPPTETFPAVRMDLKTRNAARAKQTEFFEKEEEQEEPAKKKGFFSSILEKEKVEEEPKQKVVEEEEKEEPNWFDGLFDIKSEEKTDAAADTVEKEETGSGSDFFSSLFGQKDEVKTRNGAAVEPETTDRRATKQIELDIASVVLPHPQKVSWGGEDAVFIKGRSFGVFDGVSGADKLDGIPLFSYTLADEMKRMMNEDGATIKEIINLLSDASDFANRAATGASTALVATIGKDGFLRVLNIGDSVCIVVRGDRVVARSKEIVHYFDCPYQLSEDSPDRAQDGTRFNFEVMKGDIVLMGSDGVFDNLDEMTIVETIASTPEKSNVIARRIVDLARKVSYDDDAQTPYAMLAKRNGFEDFQTGRGGKVDDVSLVVARCT